MKSQKLLLIVESKIIQLKNSQVLSQKETCINSDNIGLILDIDKLHRDIELITDILENLTDILKSSKK